MFDYQTFLASIEKILVENSQGHSEVLDLILEQTQLFTSVIKYQRELIIAQEEKLAHLEESQKQLEARIQEFDEKFS